MFDRTRLRNKSLEQQREYTLLFDFDGTLADTLEKIIVIYNRLSKKHGFPAVSVSEVEQLRGKSAREVMSALPIAKVKLPFLLAEGRKLFEEDLETILVFAGLKEVLISLSKEYRLGIVTSNEATKVKKFLLRHEIDYFDFIYADKSLFGKGKIIRQVLKKYELKAKDVVYVGDEVRDIEAAREGKIRIISVTWGFNSKKVLQEHNPDFLIDKPSQLRTIKVFSSKKK